MKHLIRIKQSLMLTALLFAFGSCTHNFADINRNKYEVDKEEIGRENYNIGSTLKGMQGLVIPTREHLYQFYDILAAGAFSGYVGSTVNNWKDKFSTYNPPAAWLKAPFVDVISETYPLYRDMFDKTDDPVALALAKLMRVIIMHRETDTYGPIPYSKVVLPDGNVSLTAPYDSQEEIYREMFAELEHIDSVFNENITIDPEAFRKFDNVYAGNIAQWSKFLHSMQLRMAMRIVYAEPQLARRIAEKAVADGVITANKDNAFLKVEENRTAMIYNDWNDHRIGGNLTCYMNGYEDPRRDKMFVKGNLKAGTTITPGFYGMRIGIDPAEKDIYVTTFSKPLISDTDPFLWMNAAEVAFLRAEGALRGWNMGAEAEALYNEAIGLSFEQFGLAGAEAYAADATKKPLAYTDPLGKDSYTTPLSDITVKWEEGTGDAVRERNLERIITQKWIAIFPLSVEAWSEYRRTGYPKLMPAALNKSGGVIDDKQGFRRLPYPAEEYQENAANVTAAIGLLGGPDNGATRLWWDKRPYNP